jgi:hypothetical protein
MPIHPAGTGQGQIRAARKAVAVPIPVNLKPGQCRPCKMHVIGVGSIFAEKRTDTNNTPPRSRLEFPLGFSEAAPSMSSPKSGMVQKQVTAQGWLMSTPEGDAPDPTLTRWGLAGCRQLDPQPSRSCHSRRSAC